MSTRKIIFLAIVGLLGLAGAIGIFLLGKSGDKKAEVPASITIWITEGSTEAYDPIIAGFKAFAPEYKNMKINIEKKTSDSIRYRTLLLSTLTDGTGPDIFMLSSGEDRILEGKRLTIPESVLPLSTFEKEYADLFLGLISTGSTEEDTETGILGVPLGYETLGIFYNKGLLREIPKTWDEIETLYSVDLGSGKYPTNLGLGPRYTPNAGDIITAFAGEKDNTYQRLGAGSKILESYLGYQSLTIPRDTEESGDTETTEIDLAPPQTTTILALTETLESEKKTSYDVFMQGDLAMILGYPSVVTELEKSTKRTGIDSIENLVLTARIPQESLSGKKKNRARYPYLSISKLSENPYGAAKFLEYLMTDEGVRKLQEAYPYLIPPKPSLYDAWQDKELSPILSRTKLDVFIPELDEELSVFDYGLKAEFNIFLSENIDRNQNIDISNIGDALSSHIDCSIALYLGLGDADLSDCEKKE